MSVVDDGLQKHANMTAEALLEDLKRHNAAMLEEHKLALEKQYQEQLQSLLQQFRPAMPPQTKALQTKIALNSAAADERNAKIAQVVLQTGPATAVQIKVYDGASKTQTLRMSAERKPPDSVVVDARTAHFAEEGEGDEYDEYEVSSMHKHKSQQAPPIHPSLKNSIYGKGSLLKSAASAAALEKTAKKLKKDASKDGATGKTIRAHNMHRTELPEPTPEEAEALALEGKLDSTTSYMLKKTSFLLDDSSKTLADVEARKRSKAKVKRRTHKNSGGANDQDYPYEFTDEFKSEGVRERMVMTEWHRRGGGSVGQDDEDDDQIEEEEGAVRQSLSRARDNLSREGPMEDNSRLVRSAQGSRGGFQSRGGGGSSPTLPPVVDRPISVGASSSGAGGGVMRVVEFNNTSLPSLSGHGNDEGTAEAGAGAEDPDANAFTDVWDTNRRVNNYEYTIDPHLVNSKIEWENEIARHVLSVYATAKVADKPRSTDQLHESTYVIDFVDIDKDDNRETVRDYVLSEDGLGPPGSPKRNKGKMGSPTADAIEEEEGLGRGSSYWDDGGGATVKTLSSVGTLDEEEARDAFDAQMPPVTPSGTRLKGKKARAGGDGQSRNNASKDKPSSAASNASDSSEQSWNLNPSMRRSTAQRARDRRDQAIISGNGNSNDYVNTATSHIKSDASAATGAHPSGGDSTITAAEAGLLYEYEESFRKTSKFRAVTLVTNPDGEEVALRGSPRCFPIWFVSTGEVYTVWSRLPGGEKLQAHLTDLHERRLYKEYLGFIERIIDGLWRERKIGKLNLEGFGSKRASIRPRVEMAPGIIAHPSVARRHMQAATSAANTGGKSTSPTSKHNLSIDSDSSTNAATSTGRQKAPYLPTHDEEDAESIWMRQKAQEAAKQDDDNRIKNEELVDLWGQMILTANAIGILCIEKKQPDLGLEILTHAEQCCNRIDILGKRQRSTLRAHVHDSLAFFFYKKGKAMSAASYTNLALEVHEKDGNVEAVGVSLLHTSALQCQMGEFKAAHKSLYQFLAMVEDGRLSFAEATPKQLCLVAVAYHNLAVVQLKLLVPDLACKSSANARKIARLCLSYSNRWMHVFQWTHDLALEDVRFQLTAKPGIPLTAKQLQVIKTLTMDMYSDDPLTS